MVRPKSLKSYIYSLIRDYKTYFLSLIIIALFASFFEVSVHYKIKEIIDSITYDESLELWYLLVAFSLLKLAQHGMFFIMRLVDIRYKPRFITRVTTDIYQQTMQHSLHWFDSHMSGEIADKINGFQVNLTHLVTALFRSLVIFSAIILGVVFLAKVNVLPALVELIFIAIYTPIMVFLLRKQMRLQESYVTANQETTGIINDSITNVFSVKTIGNMNREFKGKLLPALLRRQEWDRKTRRFDAFFVDNVDTLLVTLMAATQFTLLAYLFRAGEITAGGFTFVAMIVFALNSDLDQILDKILFEINPQIAAIRSSYAYVATKKDVLDKQGAKELKEIEGKIEFKGVDFSYAKNLPKVLDGLDLVIKPGEKIGVVGHSGAGKTTMVKCLLRYFDISKGQILIDDKQIGEVTQESLRDVISIIPQDIIMFHRSIIDNLSFAKEGASLQEIKEACLKAHIHQDIEKMPDGYDAIVGERGVKLSGGQRQRIAIARAILKDAPILILDEATSSLDSKTERLIQESINFLIEDKKKTVIAIAHRLSTLKHMDRIIVLEDGKIKEEGKHSELLKKEDSLYKRLWDLQEI